MAIHIYMGSPPLGRPYLFAIVVFAVVVVASGDAYGDYGGDDIVATLSRMQLLFRAHIAKAIFVTECRPLSPSLLYSFYIELI